MRAAKELNIKSAAIYTQEDSKHRHRAAADEAYLIGEGKDPVAAYLDADAIVKLAKRINADAIHPGYGFLSEQGSFAKLCLDNGIRFIGPSYEVVNLMGNKVACRKLAASCGVPLIPGTENPINSIDEADGFIKEFGFPIIFKAAFGGGGRGMRVCHKKEDMKSLFDSATSESQAAFGNGALFIERYIERPRHIEIQVLGDHHGNVVHLFERDCSVQRRHQKVIEIAPAPFLSASLRNKLTAYATKLCKYAGYQSAGTVEFLVDDKENIYFIEVNSRVQVEHTVTEEVTGVDIVKSQILIGEGFSLNDLKISQDTINLNGFSIQARISTEDPKNNFVPDLGRITLYEPGGGPGIRLDGACGFSGAVITPYYDSLLTKVIAKGSTFEEARIRLLRCLNEFKVEGVKTNIPFITRVLSHTDFSKKVATTDFISNHPELSSVSAVEDPSIKILKFLGTVIVNGTPTPLGTTLKPSTIIPTLPVISNNSITPGWKNILERDGPSGFAKAIVNHSKPLLTDTTLRDAHQSLLATRMRTFDMKLIAPFLAHDMSKLLSLECWGGATFDVALRFLYECPWQRLAELRELVPNIPFQMLLRGANAVGYKNYPDNVVFEFCKQAKQHGMDIFRIFDALNYVPNIKIAMDAVNKAGGVVEAAISYSGDICNPNRKKYTLDYYMNLSADLVKSGAHILCIKDMAGVLKPQAASMLVSELRKAFPYIPIHVHTHDTAGTGVATYLAAISAGAHIVDVACDSMSGMTSQPSMGGLVAALSNSKLESEILLSDVSKYSAYFEQTRCLYAPFESTVTMKSGNADVYVNEIPGGQYTNLQFQAFSLGLGSQFEEIKHKYAIANDLLGDLVKVTPSSKVVGDLAQFMVQNNLSYDDVISRADQLNFPNSVIEFFRGELGEPYQGYPEPLRTMALKGKSTVTGRPGATLPPLDLEELSKNLRKDYGNQNISDADVLSFALYPEVFKDYMKAKSSYGPVSKLPTRFLFDKCQIGEDVIIDISPSKKIYVKLLAVGEINSDGKRQLFFELDGSPISIFVTDKNVTSSIQQNVKADESDKSHIAAPMPGQVMSVKIIKGSTVKKGDVLFVLSAMKMETDVIASFGGIVSSIHVLPKSKIQAGDLLCVVAP
ncbi:hypothetical protein MXB_2328 [Myxobolus squamalis]|nr:hypothetical protein MXB_2328 [Myxobolus squamalis]